MEPRLSRYLHAKGRALGLPIGGTFELTPRCNFNCKMCYVHLTAQEQRARGRELTAAEWLDLAEKVRAAGTVFLLLTGGEPLLRPDFAEIYRQIQKMGFVVSINTNGYLIDGELRDLLLQAPPMRVNVSLYGTSNEIYERLCGLPAYDRVVQNIRTLREGGVDVRVGMAITPDNAGDLEAVLHDAQELGAKTIAAPYIFPPLRAHPERVGKNFRLPPEEAGQFAAKFDRLRLSDEVFRRHAEALCAGMPVESGQDEDCELSTVGETIGCRAGVTSFWLSWEGKLLPCGQMPTPSVTIENGDFAAAWSILREKTAELRLPRECAVCSMKNACQICAAKTLCETGDCTQRPDYLCRMTRSYIEAVSRLASE